MKILYVTDTRLPTEKAHGLSTIKLAEAFAKLGVDIELVVPKRSGATVRIEEIEKAYQIETHFPIRFAKCLDLTRFALPERLTYPIRMMSLALGAALRARRDPKQDELFIFSHDSLVLFVFSFFRWPFFYDIHHFPSENFFYRRVLRHFFGCAVQTKWKKRELNERFSVLLEKIVYWPNGTDVEKFQRAISHEEAREELGLPKEKSIALYTGQLFSWKGVETLVKAAEEFSSAIVLYIVGGSDQDIRRFQKEIGYVPHEQIVFLPFQAHDRIPLWLHAADVLLLPNTAKQKVSLYYTSPMKLFEYMASGTPMIVSDIPSIREIVDEEVSYFATPDDAHAFAEQIKAVLVDKGSSKKAREAQIRVQCYTWEERARHILEYLTRSV